MEEPISVLVPNPRHVIMPSMSELQDAHVPHIGRWNPSMCSVCRGERVFTGLVPNTVDQIGRFICNCEEQLTLSRWMTVRGISKGGRVIRWADLTGMSQEWIAEASTFVEYLDANLRIGASMILSGRSGSGKSSLASLIAKSTLYQHRTAFVLSLSGVGSDSFLSMWKDRERHERITARVTDADLLVLDDLGRESEGPSKSGNEEVARIIVNRSQEMKSTIITTNLSPSQLLTRYGEPIEALRSGSLMEMSLSESWRDSQQSHDRQNFERDNNVARPTVWA